MDIREIQTVQSPETNSLLSRIKALTANFLTVIGQTILKGDVETNGIVTQTGQPSFLVTDGTGAANVTGDGTTYTQLWPTEVYDVGGNFTSNTFTAPVTGKYFLSASVGIEGVLAGHNNLNLQIVTSNRTYESKYRINIAVTSYQLSISALADMDANDTATVAVIVDGSTKVVDVTASATNNYFSGTLIN